MKTIRTFLALSLSFTLLSGFYKANAQTICTNVPASASGGVSVGTVEAGLTYTYQASGLARYNTGPCQADPDGNLSINGQATNACGAILGDSSFTCPGLQGFSLVGKINGGSCIQLGSSGSFTPASSGELVLYFNDNTYGDNSGSWNVCIAPAGQICTNVPASASGGVSFGNVVAGQAYSYQASGLAHYNAGPCQADPDGNLSINGQATNTCGAIIGDGSFTCPGLQGFSLVGKISGGSCIQLGSSGSFTPTTSGELVLYFNDNGYGDNSGSWNVCVAPILPVAKQCATVPANASSGVSVGMIVAGQIYSYQASGLAHYNTGPCQADPDGNLSINGQATNACGAILGDSSFTCPGLQGFSLVGKINGGNCIQLGSSGSFTSTTTGELTLYFNDNAYSDNSGSWNVCIVPLPPSHSVCTNVPATASAGVPFGAVVAGHVYSYQASGLAHYNTGPCQADPDGNLSINGQATNACGAIIGDGSFTCPGLQGFSLVGKISGGSCIQLGSSGTFTPSTSGELLLYFNDNTYGDNSGSWNVCIAPAGPTCATVPASASGGISIGSVVAGQIYSYQASGLAHYNTGPCQADPDGNLSINGQATNACGAIIGDGSFTCPGLQGFSLVGKISGGSCIQLGSSGTFTPSTSGELLLYFNDNTYGDNSGSWNVCIAPVTESISAVNAHGGDVNVSWVTVPGRTYYLQATSPTDGRNYVTVSPPIVMPLSGGTATNYSDPGVVTNGVGRIYRVLIVP